MRAQYLQKTKKTDCNSSSRHLKWLSDYFTVGSKLFYLVRIRQMSSDYLQCLIAALSDHNFRAYYAGSSNCCYPLRPLSFLEAFVRLCKEQEHNVVGQSQCIHHSFLRASIVQKRLSSWLYLGCQRKCGLCQSIQKISWERNNCVSSQNCLQDKQVVNYFPHTVEAVRWHITVTGSVHRQYMEEVSNTKTKKVL